MERIVIFCCALLSVVGVSAAVFCHSTHDCPDNSSFCVLNCSAVAIITLNQPASHGNCRIFAAVDGTTVHDCYIDECNTSHPENCVPEVIGDGARTCCCSTDLCNGEFEYPLNETTGNRSIGIIKSLYLAVDIYMYIFSSNTKS